MIHMLGEQSTDGPFTKGPVLICDRCKKRISNQKEALIAYPPGERLGTFQVVHRGICDRSLKGKGLSWMDCDRFVVALMENVGLTEEDLREAKRRAATLNQIGV